MSERPGEVLVAFLKAPRQGTVKTRLVPALGATVATALSRAMAEAVLRSTRPPSGAERYARIVCFAPPDAGDEVARWLPGEVLRPQGDGDLGARMAAAFREEFGRGAKRVAVVGGDVPGLTSADIARAFASLDAAEVAIGPSEDGGYYLVGLKAPCDVLFEGIPWGTPLVLAETEARAARAGLRIAALPRRRDIDTLEDLAAEWPVLSRSLRDNPALVAAVDKALAAVAALRSPSGP